jgi:hypothetical protein
MSENSWVKTLAAARQRPALYQGWPPDAHLQAGIREPLRLVWEKQAFERAGHAAIIVSPNQYHCRCYAGSLVRGVERLIAWDEWDILLRGVHRLHQELGKEPAEWARPFCESTFYIGAFGGLLYLAERGVVGIRTSTGLWCQAYERGWPKAAPFLADESGARTGLMVGAALNPHWCPGLPYTPEAVEKAIPDAARPYVTVEWHPEDDLLPECPIDPGCVLHPENIGRWL